jgi:hypothetical protein
MNDEIDTYLSLSLKNWAARKQPPSRGRERLLRLARNAAWLENLEAPENYCSGERFLSGKNRAARAWPERPMLVTRRWSLGIATTYHFVA